MYFYTTTAKGTRLNHGAYNKQFMADKKDYRTIKKGDKVLVLSNGTIGPGARSENYGKVEALDMLRGLILEIEK